MRSKQSIQKVISTAISLSLLLSLLTVPGSAPVSATGPMQSYIVQGQDAVQVARLVEKYGGQVTSQLEIIQGVGAMLTPQACSALLKEPGISAITLNGTVRLSGNGHGNGNGNNTIPASDYPDVVGADLVWQQGVNGADITVAIVDTGLGWHPGLLVEAKGRLKDRIVGWKDFVDGRKLPIDPNGHGTHVAGVIANAQAGTDNEWDGVAPGVSLVGVRVLDEEGSGTYERVIQGIQWVVSKRAALKIRVLNLSIVAPVQSPYWADPLNLAVMRAWQAGIIVISSAGNGGPGPMTIGVPGNNPYIITVGAFTDNYTPDNWNDDYIAPFSAAGPTLDGFVKPDVIAPGAHMVSTMMPFSYLARNHEANQVTPYYFSMAGTSQAAGVVSGIAALTLSKNPSLTPDQVKYRLLYTAFPWVDPVTANAGYSIWQQGMGRVNAPDAVMADISGQANYGLDIAADLAGTTHYEGFSYYDETSGEFRLRGDFSSWMGGFGNWSGGFGNWSGGFGNWSGGFGNWSGGFGNWSGGFGNWSGGFGNWSGGFGNWSGGFGNWSGGFGNWSGSEPWSGSVIADPAFISNFLSGVSPNASSTTSSINNWVDEP